MGSILKKAVRGFAEAGVSVADGALAELRQRRLMELQQSFSREERNLDRADRKDERKQDIELRSQERQQEMELRREDKNYQRQRDQSEDAYRQQTLKKSDDQFNKRMGVEEENNEFTRVQGMIAGALSGLNAARQRLANAEALQLKTDRDGQPLEDPAAFQERRATMLAAAEAEVEKETNLSKEQIELIRTEFPQHDKWFPKQPKKPEYPVTGQPTLLKDTPARLGWTDRVKEMDALSRNSAAGMLRQ